MIGQITAYTYRNGHAIGVGSSSSGTAVFPKKQPSIVGKVSSTLFEEDPGVMSEAETASTSSHLRKSHHHHHQHDASASDPRKGSSSDLPVVRTPSKTLEKPLGIVFLIFRGETKRALLPNEITSVITVKALFVRDGIKVEVCCLKLLLQGSPSSGELGLG